MTWLCIALGGALGSLARHGLSLALANATFPLGTFTANALGSLAIGIAAGMWEMPQRSTPVPMFVMTGFCGGFTTFSTFSLQTLELFQEGNWQRAGLNIGASLGICLLCTWGGFLLAQSLKKNAA